MQQFSGNVKMFYEKLIATEENYLLLASNVHFQNLKFGLLPFQIFYHFFHNS